MLQRSTIKFLQGLKKNNNREWFEANRKQYEAAKNAFASFVQLIIDRHGKKDAEINSLKAKDCIFRINRDIRFSKNKTPYKSNFGASINRGGKKSCFAGYYFHCEPGQSFAGGGLWMPMPEDLKKVRQEIDYDFDEFKKIITNKKFKAIYGDLYKGDDVSLSRPPKGYDEENSAIEYLKLKSLIATRAVTNEDLTGKNLSAKISEAFEALQPLIKFINKALIN